jgi:hypothetical protein
MSNLVSKPIVLESDGVMGQLPDGALINAGGTASPTFTVAGRGLLFSDGTSTAGGSGSAISLQSAYFNSPTVNGAASIQLTTGKNFLITDSVGDGNYFQVDAATGQVTVFGNLVVHGASTIIDTVVQRTDHWQIAPSNPTQTALYIEPVAGVFPTVDMVNIKVANAGPTVFKIDLAGNTTITQNLTVGGLINGVNLPQLAANFQHHLNGDPGFRHTALQVDVTPIAGLQAVNVQQALENINSSVVNLQSGINTSTTRGYEYNQLVTSTSWTIVHNLNTRRVQVSLYDSLWEQIIPESTKIIDQNTVRVSFLTAQAGRAMVIGF